VGKLRLTELPLKGAYLIEPNTAEDHRGSFIKIYNESFFQANGLDIAIKESYYSISKKNVIRGMHFQTPPHDHLKIVYVPQGGIIDVILDIRKNSPTYGKFFTIELSDKNGKAAVIPTGMAHGFRVLEENTNVTYLQTSCYAAEYDTGIHYNSFGFDWEISNPILSRRDEAFSDFKTFDSPFVFGHKK
jgi:dTDP-4-dehydrorhamnose 3,5-epimerase